MIYSFISFFLLINCLNISNNYILDSNNCRCTYETFDSIVSLNIIINNETNNNLLMQLDYWELD